MRKNLGAILALLFGVSTLVNGQDFPQWRGSNRDGRIDVVPAISKWPSQLRNGWKIEVGTGHSSPLVVGNRVYIHARQGENEVVSALDPGTGKRIWQDSYSVAYSVNPAAREHGKGPKSTPVYAGGRLYTLGITAILSCYEVARGRLLWRRNLGDRFVARAPLYGTAMSPIVDRGPDQGGLIALDELTGKERWAWTGDGPGYASPIITEIAGKRQLVTQTEKYIVGIWVDTGALLWKIPFETDYSQNIITPVAWRDLLIFSGYNKGVMAVRVGWRDNQWVTDQVWQNRELSMYMSSPVVSGSWLFGFSHRNKGQHFCLDLESGRTLWTGDPRQGENAAILIVGGSLITLSELGELRVSSVASKGATLIRKYQVADGATWAHPVISGNRILIRDALSLRLWLLG